MKETITYLRQELNRIYPPRETEAIIRLIFEHLKGWKPVDIVLNEDKPLSDYMRGKVEAILERLKKGEPIQYILGTAHFYGLDFNVTPDVLIPRPETAEMVDLIVRQAGDATDLRVLDAGTGSGCIAIALARNLKFPQVTAIDNSEPALAVAEGNAKKLRCRISFSRADILALPKAAAFAGEQWDIIVSNPPYIALHEKADMEANVLNYEPDGALFVPDDDPLVFYRAIAEYGQQHLSAGAHIYFEVNPLYADSLSALMQRLGYTDINIYRDIQKNNRFLTAVAPSNK
ncbi:MAG: peptide chain release factor N(5)-glutamine methyltransferase [Muribaculaceae bacterium]|nr:peptide chain release factor N(5)-glutamine methyltransferase [Muribaculaceae bacterium]